MATPLLCLGAALSCATPTPSPQAALLAVSAETEVAEEPAKVDAVEVTLWQHRDPFRSLGPTTPPSSRRGMGLQAWELDELKLVGVSWSEGEALALIEDPQGQGRVARVGDYVGTKWGRISRIASDGVIATEEALTGDGQLVVVDTRLSLPLVELAAVP
jgi:Tfp pilus assembly protein PilP